MPLDNDIWISGPVVSMQSFILGLISKKVSELEGLNASVCQEVAHVTG